MDGSYLLEKGSRMEKELYKIAICDDDIRICTELEKSILEYARYNHKLLSVEPYYGEQKLCQDLRDGIIYDMLFIDIELGSALNGIDIGLCVRNTLKNEAMQIIYISSFESYALELFKIRPLDFLVKPISKERIYETLDTGIRLAQKNEITFQYKQGRDWNKIYIKNIIYFRSIDREVEAVTVNDNIIFYGSLEKIYEQLKTYNFFYAHKSYLINYAHVKEFFYEELIMTNDDVIKIAQPRRKKVREIHKKFLLGDIQCR